MESAPSRFGVAFERQHVIDSVPALRVGPTIAYGTTYGKMEARKGGWFMRGTLEKRLFVVLVSALLVTRGLGPVEAGTAVTSGTATSIAGPGANRLLRLAAGGDPAVCKANYEQRVKACGGMSGCSDQCATNYRKCLGQ